MKITKELEKILGKGNVSTDPLVVTLHSTDAIGKAGNATAVVFPENTEQVARIAKLCYENNIKIYPQGSSTELSGSSVPEDGIVINFSKMNKIEEINVVDGYAVAQPGVRIAELEERLNEHSYTFPVDPGSVRSATVGGAINTGAGGMRGAKYGTMVDWVLGLEVVTADGEVLNIGSRTLKCRQGYNLTKLIVGSEGTLAIVTKAILKIAPLPENIVYAGAFFDSPEKAMQAVVEIKHMWPAIMEFLDSDLVKAGREISGIDEEGNMLVVGIECNHEASERIASALESILSQTARRVIIARNQRELEEKNLLALRRAFYPLAIKLASKEFGTKKSLVLIEDISVPVSKLPEAIRGIKEIARKYDFTVFIAGHVGDGNLHPTIWTSPEDEELMSRSHKFYTEVMELALRLGGTISAEHGIGVVKKEGLEMEMKYKKSEKALEIMREIKKLFDPKNILNPGKVV
ncbi:MULTISPECIES: glycolate oxidase subunit GlcD [Archaeoglobus]|uniref:D-lactate dehydrogenase (cytochrome) n=2 Tax=Archaeoglobus fulgidus TaxID=2234 RepID=O29450_ARCFU|nr:MULTISPECIES: glycolate oxidase subunit GlcD [Archaeoglobus]AAB90434.1 glycolate oxidase subunit (glcD) [Archaeoglobus fulgidus DSM 4304]AIG97685.1 glycolate oxidase, subunit GlcD [Archaeoglobus fulgidus DSM 8774]MDI3498426.1 glycolate oxidase [Archaeoglobus sp.]